MKALGRNVYKNVFFSEFIYLFLLHIEIELMSINIYIYIYIYRASQKNCSRFN